MSKLLLGRVYFRSLPVAVLSVFGMWLSMALCVFGLPVVAISLNAMVKRQLRVVWGMELRNSVRAGVFYLCGFGLIGTAMIAGAAVVHDLVRGAPLPVAIGLYGSVLLIVTIGLSLIYVPLILTDPRGEESYLGAIHQSTILVSRLPASRQLALVLGVTLPFALPGMLLIPAFSVNARFLIGFASTFFALPFASACVVTSYVDVADELPDQRSHALGLTRYLSLAAGGVFVLAVVAAALLTPLVPEHAAYTEDQTGVEMHPRVTIGDVTTTVVPDGVVVSTSDGGGAGLITFGSEEIRGVRVERGNAVACSADRLFLLRLSPRGVRLDDSLSDRIDARIGKVGGGLLALCLLLITLYLSVGVRWLARTASLRVLTEKEQGTRQDVRALTGTVRDDEALASASDNGRAVRAPGVLLRSRDGLATQFPDAHVRRIGSRAFSRENAAGRIVTLVGVFSRLVPDARGQTIPWPSRARVIVGTLEEAVAEITLVARRRADILLVITCLVLVTTGLFLGLQLSSR